MLYQLSYLGNRKKKLKTGSSMPLAVLAIRRKRVGYSTRFAPVQPALRGFLSFFRAAAAGYSSGFSSSSVAGMA